MPARRGRSILYFFAGNHVMIDFKSYFYYHFFNSRHFIRSLRNDADCNGYVPILIAFFIYWSQSKRGGWDLIYLFGIHKRA